MLYNVLVHSNIVVYALCYWLTQPILPFLSKDLGADMVVFGYFQTSVSILQFIGAPVVGRLCDTHGPKSALLMSHVAATALYAGLSLANSIPTLFASQIPTLFLHCMHAAQAAITNHSTDSDRASSLGKLSLSYSIGMISGSFIGGQLATFAGNRVVAMTGATLSLMMVVVNLLALENTKSRDKDEKNTSDWFRGFKLVRRDITLRHLILIQIGIGIALMVFRTSLSQILRTAFDMRASDIGMFMSFSGCLSVLTNVLFIPFITKKQIPKSIDLTPIQLLVDDAVKAEWNN